MDDFFTFENRRKRKNKAKVVAELLQMNSKFEEEKVASNVKKCRMVYDFEDELENPLVH